MAEPSDKDNGEAAERYKQAANDALQMLDWCIGYLEGIHKGSIASTLAQNRSYIRTRLMHEAEEPVPSKD